MHLERLAALFIYFTYLTKTNVKLIINKYNKCFSYTHHIIDIAGRGDTAKEGWGGQGGCVNVNNVDYAQ